MKRSEQQFGRGYMVMSVFIFTAVFATYSYLYGDADGLVRQILLLVVVPTVVATLLLLIGQHEYNSLFRIKDRSIKPMTDKRIPLVSKAILTETYYYPAIDTNIMPIFSFGAVFNFTIGICASAYGVGFFMAMWKLSAIPVIPILLAISVALCWLALVITHIPAFIKISKSAPDGFVDMQYSIEDAEALIKNQVVVYYDDLDVYPSKTKDLLKYLLENGISEARRINNLILYGYADPKLLVNEVKTIEYIINTFVPQTLITSKAYFKQHEATPDAAKKVYMRDVHPKIHAEALVVKEQFKGVIKTVSAINHQVKKIAAQKEAAIEHKIEQSIGVDSMLAILNEKTVLPVSAFPEFHTLQFKDDAKRAAAENIVSGALQHFVEAESAAKNPQDKLKLAGEIDEIKTFVKALASDTPESAAREARLIAKEKEDPLYIEGGHRRIDDVDNMIASNKHYLESYDNTLPINKD